MLYTSSIIGNLRDRYSSKWKLWWNLAHQWFLGRTFLQYSCSCHHSLVKFQMRSADYKSYYWLTATKCLANYSIIHDKLFKLLWSVHEELFQICTNDISVVFIIMNCNIVDVVYKFLFNVVCLTVEKLFIIFKWWLFFMFSYNRFYSM